MQATINGQVQVFAVPPTVAELLTLLGADGNRVAVLINEAVVAKNERATRAIADGDRVEVLTFAGGG